MIYVLFNPLANNSHGELDAKNFVSAHLKEKNKLVSVIGLKFKEFFDKTTKDDEVILAGGDGTLNRFINDTYGYDFKCKLSYTKCGSGNDFYRDVADKEVDGRVDLKPYVKYLPLITVNGIKKRFINGIGYGIDGDTCLVGDEIRAKDPSAKINYAGIAVKLLLFKYKNRDAKVIVDGKEYNFKKVWIASAMNGKYYGGGMMAAPDKDRLAKDPYLDVCIFKNAGRLSTLFKFPKFSAGQHKGKKYLVHLTGKKITISFAFPCALQIDGDVVKDVTTYSVEI